MKLYLYHDGTDFASINSLFGAVKLTKYGVTHIVRTQKEGG